MLIGHERIQAYFEVAVQNKTLGHAYGFIGPGSLGKRAFVRALSAKLLSVSQEKLAVHPDYVYIERGEDEKTGKLKKNISVAEAREIRARLQHTSFSNSYRIVVINEAELLNTEAASALLKILEEPPKNSIFFLLIENETSVPATIKSRLEPFYFMPVRTSEIAAGLKRLGVNSPEVEKIAGRARGCPGKAICMLDKENEEKYSQDLDLFTSLIGAPFYKKIEIIEKLFGDAEDGERGRAEWQKTLDNWIAWFRDLLLDCYGISGGDNLKIKSKYTGPGLLLVIDALQRVKVLLRQNAHPRLAIEETMLKF